MELTRTPNQSWDRTWLLPSNQASNDTSEFVNDQSMNDTMFGAIIGGAISAFVTWITLRHQSKQHMNGLIIQASLEIWRRKCEITDRASKETVLDRASQQVLGTPNLKDPDFMRTVQDVRKSIEGLK